MIILLFGISNVGKSTVGKIVADTLKIPFYDLDDEIKKLYNITLEEFVSTGTLRERDEKRGRLIGNIVKNNDNCLIAVTPISHKEYFSDFLNMNNIIAIEITDSAKNIFDRLVFSDEDDNIYEDIEYKNLHKAHYMREIIVDIAWFSKVYEKINNKCSVNNLSPEQVAELKKITSYTIAIEKRYPYEKHQHRLRS